MRLLLLVLAGLLSTCPPRATAQAAPDYPTVVIVSADAEWRQVRKLFPQARYQSQPFGEFFAYDPRTLVVQGGWGKVSAAASVQYAIDRWHPQNIINLGTCGGIAGRIDRYAIAVATRTVVYDIVEQMGDAQEALHFYSTDTAPDWAGRPWPGKPVATVFLSADRDLLVGDIAGLIAKYDARVVDWESGAIAWTARRNDKRVLILRGVSDLVSTAAGGEAYGNPGAFEDGTGHVMEALFAALPDWLAAMDAHAARPATVK